MSSPPEIPGVPEKDMKIVLTNSCLIFRSPGYGFSNFITLLTAKMNYLNEGEVAHILAYQPSRLYVIIFTETDTDVMERIHFRYPHGIKCSKQKGSQTLL